MFDPRKCRAAVRAAFEAGKANRYGSGPWLPESWYYLAWYIWRKSGMILEITEEKTDSRVSETGPTHGSGPLARSETVITETAHFLAEVTAADLWRGLPFDAPVGSSIWWHGSRTAYGPGLYHCEGYISLRGELTTTSKVVVTGDDGESSVSEDSTHTETHHVVMEYSTDPADLNGLGTFCRITVQQLLPPVAAFFFDPTLWFTQPTDPDGNIGVPPYDLVAEVYWTDAALAALAGSWNAEMILLTDSMTIPQGPNDDGIDNGGSYSQTWSRSGHLSLTGGP